MYTFELSQQLAVGVGGKESVDCEEANLLRWVEALEVVASDRDRARADSLVTVWPL